MRKTNPFELFEIRSTDAPLHILQRVAERLDRLWEKPHFFASVNGQVINLADVPALVIQVAIQSFEKQQDFRLFHALIHEALMFESHVLKGTGPGKRPNYGLWTMRDRINSMHLVIAGLKQRVLEGGNPVKPSISALHLLAMLENQLPPTLIDGLLIEDYGQLRTLLFAELPTLLHYARRSRPLETQKYLGELQELTALDPVFAEKMDLLQDKTAENLDAWKAFRLPKPGLKQNNPLQHYPAELAEPDTLMGKIQHFFGMRRERGPSKSVQLAYVSLVSFAALFLTVTFSMALFTSKKVEIEFDHHRPRYVEVVPKFKQVASTYKGNQLANGSIAFPFCYGAPVYDQSAANSTILKNHLEEDAVAVFYNTTTKKTIRQTYVQASRSVLIRDLPNGSYQVKFYIGKDWNPLKPNFCGLHGAFDTNPHYVMLSMRRLPFELEGGSHKKLHLNLPDGALKSKDFPDISASMFFFNHYDIHEQ